jgi:hypothetical protein
MIPCLSAARLSVRQDSDFQAAQGREPLRGREKTNNKKHPKNMKKSKRRYIVLLSAFLPLIGLTQIPDGPYWGQKPPGSKPEIFAPGLVSLPGRRDTKIVFSPDGRECFIGMVENRAFTIYDAKRENGHWSQPVCADFLGGNAFHTKTGGQSDFLNPFIGKG